MRCSKKIRTQQKKNTNIIIDGKIIKQIKRQNRQTRNNERWKICTRYNKTKNSNAKLTFAKKRGLVKILR